MKIAIDGKLVGKSMLGEPPKKAKYFDKIIYKDHPYVDQQCIEY